MRKIKILLKISLFLVFAVLSSVLSSCAKTNGKTALCEFLSKEYTAEVEYSLEGENGSISGTAIVSYNDGVQITFSSPDVFEGMTVENTVGGKLGNIYFTYYGMRLPLPDKSLQKVNLLLSLFSGNMQTSLATLGRSSFSDANEEELKLISVQDVNSAKKCTFTYDDNESYCTVIYDPTSGKPYRFAVSDGENNATLTFLKIKTQ